MTTQTVLVIDDSATIRTMVDRHLSQDGYRVVLAPTAGNGPNWLVCATNWRFVFRRSGTAIAWMMPTGDSRRCAGNLHERQMQDAQERHERSLSYRIAQLWNRLEGR